MAAARNLCLAFGLMSETKEQHELYVKFVRTQAEITDTWSLCIFTTLRNKFKRICTDRNYPQKWNIKM